MIVNEFKWMHKFWFETFILYHTGHITTRTVQSEIKSAEYLREKLFIITPDQ